MASCPSNFGTSSFIWGLYSGGGGGGGVLELCEAKELEAWTRRLLTSSVRTSILAVSEAIAASKGEVGVNGSAMRVGSKGQ